MKILLFFIFILSFNLLVIGEEYEVDAAVTGNTVSGAQTTNSLTTNNSPTVTNLPTTNNSPAVTNSPTTNNSPAATNPSAATNSPTTNNSPAATNPPGTTNSPQTTNSPGSTPTPQFTCHNGGLQITDKKCLCQGLFEGTQCEITKCVSGGYLNPSTKRCTCPKGYIGYHCEGSKKHPKPQNIFTKSQTSFNVFVMEDSTEYYGKLGLKIFKEQMINHINNNQNNYKNYLIGYDYSTSSGSVFSTHTTENVSDFINFINTTIIPQKPVSYMCYGVSFYQNLIKMIKDNMIVDSPLVIYTQHPPNDYDLYKEELEELVMAFRIRITILFQNDLFFDGCDETEDDVKKAFDALRDVAFISGGMFYQLNSDEPESGIKHSFDILYNPQMVSYSMNDNCSGGVSLNYESDLFVSTGHLIIESDTPIDMSKQINPLFNIISYSHDNKTITLSSNKITPSGSGKNILNIQNVPGSCSIQFLTLYPSQQSQQGIDIYYSYIPNGITNKDGTDSGYMFMLQNSQNFINFNVEKQEILKQYSFSSNNSDLIVKQGSYVTQDSNVSFMDVINGGDSVFGYTLGSPDNTFKCDVNKRSWFMIVVEVPFPGKNYFYQRYVPVKCYVPLPLPTEMATTESIDTTTGLLSTISTSQQVSSSSSQPQTTPKPPTRTSTFGIVTSCGVDYSIAMPYLNGIASLTQSNLSDTFYNNGYLYFADSTDPSPVPTFYDTFSQFIDNLRTLKKHCGSMPVTSYVDTIQGAINMITDDKFQKNSPLVLVPITGQVITVNSQKLIKPLIELAVSKRISIHVMAQFDSKNFKSINMFQEVVKATNGHMFFLNHNLRYDDNSYFAQKVVNDYFVNVYPNNLIQSRSIVNDYSVGDYGKIVITEVKDVILSVSSDALSQSPTNGYILNVKMINNNGSVIKKSLTSFNGTNEFDEYTNYEYIVFKDLPPDEYTISLQALIYPLDQISVRVWEVVDVNNYYNFMDVSYLSIVNKTLSSEIPDGPNSDNGIILSTDISIDGDVNDISKVTCDIKQLTGGVATNDILMNPINSINTGIIKMLSSTRVQVIFNPIIDLRSTDSSYFNGTSFDWPIYKGDVVVYFGDGSQKSYTFNLFTQDDYTNFVPNIDYEKLTQGKNNQFYYCENGGLLKYTIPSNGYECQCESENYSGTSCEIIKQCLVETTYPGKNDDKYRIFTVVLATSPTNDIFYDATSDLIGRFTLTDVTNIWQFRLYYLDNNKNLVSYYIGNDLKVFQESFNTISEQSPPDDYICISEIKNKLYKYLPSGVKGLVWLVTDEGISLATPMSMTTMFPSSSTLSPPIDGNCPDDVTNGYNQDLFYIYHDNSNDDYLKNNGKLIFNSGGPLKFDNPSDYLDISHTLLQKLFSGGITTNNHLDELTTNFNVNIESSKEAFVLVLGDIDSKLTNPTSALGTSKFVSLYSVKDKDTLQSSLTNDLPFITTYVIDGFNVDVAYLRNNLYDEPSAVPGIGNLTFALYPPPSIQDINIVPDQTNTFKTERNGCSYKYSFRQQTSTDTQDKLKFTFKDNNNLEYTKVYPNNQVYTTFDVLMNNSSLPITCRNGVVTPTTSILTPNLYYCVCDNNFRGVDCSIPKCQNGGKLSGMQGVCDCSGTSYYGEFCSDIVS